MQKERKKVILISTRELVETSSLREDNEPHLGIAQNRELIGFLQQTIAAFCKGDLTVDLVLYPLQLYPSSPHFDLVVVCGSICL